MTGEKEREIKMKKTMDLSFLTFDAQETAMELMKRLGWKYLGGHERCTYELPDEDEHLFDFIECGLD